MTHASEDFLNTLYQRRDRWKVELETETNEIKRAVAAGWQDATNAAIFDFHLAQPRIEAESFFGDEA